MANPQSNPASKSKESPNGKGSKKEALLAELEQLAAAAPPPRRESAGKAVGQLVMFALLLGAVGGGYRFWAKQAGKVFDTLKEVRDVQRQDSLDKLKEARAKLNEAVAVKAEGRLVSLLAETDVLLACDHLQEDAKADAEKYVTLASNDDVVREERYSAEGYWKICQGQAAGAEEYMTRILNKGASQPRIYHALGMAFLAQGKTVEAQATLKTAAEKGAGNPRFPLGLAHAEMRLGNYFEAVQQYTRAVNANGSHVFARIGKALAEGMGGVEAAKVLRDVDEALKPSVHKVDGKEETVGPSNGERAAAAYAKAEILARTGSLDAAEKSLTAAEKMLGPTHLDGRHLLLHGKLALLKGDEAKALKAFEEAAKREPTNPTVYIQPATLLLDLNKGEPALARLQAFQKAKLAETATFFSLLGDALQSRGKAEDAAKAYQQALEKEESNVRAIMGTARLLLEKKKWEDAGAMFEKVTQMQPDNGDPWYYMGGAYIEQKDFNYASQMSDKAAELYIKRNAEPRFRIKALRQAGKAYELAKKRKDAEERYKAAESLEKLR